MKLVVHIGPGKTGSTAIQKSLKATMPQLAEHGVSYLGLMFEHARTRKFDWQRPGGFDAFARLPVRQAEEELEEIIEGVVRDASESGVHTCVLSNESLLRRGGVVRGVLERMRKRGQVDVVIAAYARNHIDLARSAYVQWGLVHKTYKGAIRPFRKWMHGRDLALYPKLAEWATAFGDSFVLRNYDATPDVVIDFLEAASLGGLPVESIRTYETPDTNEILLRSLFNDMHDEGVAPSRFSKLFETASLRFDRPAGDWFESLFPDDASQDRLAEALSDDQENINRLLQAQGQPGLGNGRATSPAEHRPQTEALITTLFQMVSKLALKVEKLEQQHAARKAIAPDHEPALRRKGTGSRPAGWPEGLPCPEAMEALAPALGYFGAHAVDCLEIPVTERLRGLRISLDEPKPVFLNLRGLELVRAGKPIPVDRLGAIVEQSSIASDDVDRNGPSLLLACKGIHSKAEQRPWWQARFAQPIECDALRIWNRSDGWGSRSRTMRVECIDGDRGAALLHDSRSAPCLLEVLADLVEASEGRACDSWPESMDEARNWREARLDAVARRLCAGELRLADARWRSLMQVVDVWGREGEPSQAAWTVIAAFLLHQYQGKGGTSIKAMSLLLNTRGRLLRLQDEINRLAAALGLGRFMLTRHGVKSEGLLRREPGRFVAHLQSVVAALDALGREPVLAYGTLLGAVRDGDFIAHDDDIDLIYRSHACSRREAEQDVLSLKETLRGRGFKVVDLLPNSLNMHVIDPRNGAVMDVFPCWMEDGRLHMHMESMKIRGIDPGIIYPAGDVEFRGVRLPAPAQPHAFLDERYGAGWSVPDQFYEWPWPLKEAS